MFSTWVAFLFPFAMGCRACGQRLGNEHASVSWRNIEISLLIGVLNLISCFRQLRNFQACRGVRVDMRRRWGLVLPLCGLALFLLGTYGSFRFNREIFGNRPTRYFYWSSIRLDSDPLNKHQYPYFLPCKSGEEACVEPQTMLGIEPGVVSMLLRLAALPAFIVGAAIVRGLARFGLGEVTTFLISMPLLILAWFYLIGSLIDRWQYKMGSRPVASSQG